MSESISQQAIRCFSIRKHDITDEGGWHTEFFCATNLIPDTRPTQITAQLNAMFHPSVWCHIWGQIGASVSIANARAKGKMENGWITPDTGRLAVTPVGCFGVQKGYQSLEN
jgi:hypothetical protein